MNPSHDLQPLLSPHSFSQEWIKTKQGLDPPALDHPSSWTLPLSLPSAKQIPLLCLATSSPGRLQKLIFYTAPPATFFLPVSKNGLLITSPSKSLIFLPSEVTQPTPAGSWHPSAAPQPVTSPLTHYCIQSQGNHPDPSPGLGLYTALPVHLSPDLRCLLFQTTTSPEITCVSYSTKHTSMLNNKLCILWPNNGSWGK